MSKVSVTGSKAVMAEVIEAAHDLRLLHVSDYDGSWSGFSNGDPLEGAEEASDKLVTVRSLESILDVDAADAGPRRIVTDEALDEQLEEVRVAVNELDDRRSELEDALRHVEERIDAVEPFVDLGLDLDLLSGYESLSVAVGEGDVDALREALSAADGVDAFETFAGEHTVAVFVRPAADYDGNALDDALVGTEFARVEIPDASGSPGEYVRELEHERQKLESKIESVESELNDARLEHAGFLLAVEEKLAIDVQKREIPLEFATTEHAFVAEGWLPSEDVDAFEHAVREAAGESVDVEELERASYDPHGNAHAVEPVDSVEEGAAVADGGEIVGGDRPPVLQHNPMFASPFELLVRTISVPKYAEIDPTIVVFLTFPVFFGLMIGDVGYGLLYVAMGYWIYTNFDSPGFKSFGGIAIWAGALTALFGLFYGEIMGTHLIAHYLWAGEAPLHKGLEEHYASWAQMWLVVAMLVGLVHLTVAWVFDFRNKLSHSFTHALLESASWLMLTLGIWTWIFSTSAVNSKPGFIYTVFSGDPLPFGFTGLPASLGVAGLVVAAVGLVLLIKGEGIGSVEAPNSVVHVLSYSRLTAEIIAEVGIAFVVNMLAGGLFAAGPVGWIPGLLILVFGHAMVLALGITSAGLQALRLEYVEFFGKFYEGGGAKYEPFGYQKTHTTED